MAATPRVEPIGSSPVVPTRGPLRPLGLAEAHLVELIDLVRVAQAPDGHLNTAFGGPSTMRVWLPRG